MNLFSPGLWIFATQQRSVDSVFGETEKDTRRRTCQVSIFLFPFTDISEPHHAQAQLSDNHQHQNQETEVTIETRGIILNELPTTTSNVAQ